MNLVSVYKYPNAAEVLFELLKERDGAADVNISHNGIMPDWRHHCRFVKSKPYRVWFLIMTEDEKPAGSIYLSKRDEIGIFLFKRFQGRGLGAPAVKELMERTPRKQYFANINSRNERSIAFFEALGFNHIQNTYARGRSL